MVSFFTCTTPIRSRVGAIDNPDLSEQVFDQYNIPEDLEKIFTHDFLMIGRQKMFIFGIRKAFTNNFTDYNLYERKLEVIVRKKYAIHFFIQLLDFSPETSEDELNLHKSLEKNLDVV